MAESNEFGCTLMSEVCITAAKAGWEPKHFSKLAQNENLMRQIRGVLNGTHKIKGAEHIDCNAEPFTPKGWIVEKHQRMAKLQFNPSEIDLYIFEEQTGIVSSTGHELLHGLEKQDKKVLNANVLDYLLDNIDLIPEDWKKLKLVFWGTVYQFGNGVSCVRYLCWEGRWIWKSRPLAGRFWGSYAALLKS